MFFCLSFCQNIYALNSVPHFNYAPIVLNDYLKLTPKLEFFGFELKVTEGEFNQECKITDSYLYSLALIIAKKNNQKNVISNSAKCLKKISPEYAQFLSRWVYGDGLITQSPEMEAIKNQILKKKENIAKKNLNEEIENLKNNKKMDLKTNSTYRPYLNHLNEMAHALVYKNTAKAKSEVRKLLALSPERIIFEISPDQFRSAVERNEWSQSIIFLFRTFTKMSQDPLLIKLLGSSWESLLGDLDGQILEEMGVWWPKNDIEKGMKSFNYGQLFPGVWTLILGQYGVEKEIKEYFERISHQVKGLWVDVYATEKKMGLKLVEKDILIYERECLDEDYHCQYLLLKLAKIESIKRLLGKQNQKYLRPIFIQEREFWRKVLESGEAIDAALYHLALLGDKSLENLWWKVF